jgi:hypothetical protein
MSNSISAVAAKIKTCLAAVSADGKGAFVVGHNKVEIDQRGISIILHDQEGTPVALRLHRPMLDVSCWGYVLAGKPGEVDSSKPEDMSGYEVITSLSKMP